MEEILTGIRNIRIRRHIKYAYPIILEGKEGVIGALVGAVMKETKGQANPKIVNQKLVEILKS